MSTRRARIKAVASLPVRRKALDKEKIGNSEQQVSVQALPNAFQSEKDVECQLSQTCLKIIDSDTVKGESPSEQININKAKTPRESIKPTPQRKLPVEDIKLTGTVTSPLENKQLTSPQQKKNELINRALEPESTQIGDQGAANSVKDAPQRRRIVKPAINIPGLNRKNKVQEKAVCNVQSTPVEALLPVPNVVVEGESVGVGPEECRLDPIVPLPSGQRNRLKLRPPPRFALRRNSLQGSASESEEVVESSPAPVPPPAPAHTPVPPSATVASVPPQSTLPGHPPSVPRAVRAPRLRGAARCHHKGPHQALTMYDLIFYNPPNNALPPKDGEERREETVRVPSPTPPPAPLETEPQPEAAPVPQVKLGPNGEIVLDEQSLVIETSETLRSRQRLSQLSVVWEGAGGGSGGSYGRARRCREWGHTETLRFYRALHTLGTDFSLMLSLFPGRSRRDLKSKFKKEEKQNGALVDRALMNPLQFNISHLEEELARLQSEEAEREQQRNKEPKPATLKRERERAPRGEGDSAQSRKKKYRPKSSMALKSIEDSSNSYLSGPSHPKGNRLKKLPFSLCTDILASEEIEEELDRATKLEAVEEPPQPAPELGSPGVLVPPHLESGSMVLVAGEGGALRAYVAQRETPGESRLLPVALPSPLLRSIAARVGVRPATTSSLVSL